MPERVHRTARRRHLDLPRSDAWDAQLAVVAKKRLQSGGGGRDAHQPGDEPHHHLICRVCGAETALGAGHVEALRGALLAEAGFNADLDRVNDSSARSKRPTTPCPNALSPAAEKSARL